MRFVRERLYEGQYGQEEDEEDADPVWCVRWPRDTAAGAAALWVFWFFEGWDTLRAEPKPARRALMALLLPFVVMPFRVGFLFYPCLHSSMRTRPARTLRILLRACGVPGPLPRHGDVGAAALRGSVFASAVCKRAAVLAWYTPPRSALVGRLSLHPLPPAPLLPCPSPPPSSPAHLGRGGRRSRCRRCTDAARALHPPAAGTPGRNRRAADALALAPTLHDIQDEADETSLATHAQTSHTSSPSRPRTASLLARVQTGGRMGVPPHLARDRAEAGTRWAASGGTGRGRLGRRRRTSSRRTRADCARGSGAATASPAASTPVDPAVLAAHAAARAEAEAKRAVPFVEAAEDLPRGKEERTSAGRRARGAPGFFGCGHGRGRYVDFDSGRSFELGVDSTIHCPGADERRLEADRVREGEDKRMGRGGAARGGLDIPSEPPYTALLSAPGGAFPRGGLVHDAFVAAARPVYIHIAEHHSFHPHTPVPPPPPDSTTGEEGMRAGWLPCGARFLPLSVRVPNTSFTPGAAPGFFEAQFGYADADVGRASRWAGAEERGEGVCV
ncbi:hypothetical protein B0H17DRAFT_1337587 [Mycena rosella]|uniref:Uncharacterized protein n=1 Tax=Mycena rosella TaxID=1033263 RepID=A0AAD7CR72_MYCRO|nr:hypothetical protein B0H17DRAFT_1337587 [Mycena rosella]